ncbi:HAMP domain-containing sensor histidine kinase [Marivirga sp.]|uniref:sensor histidine kinase n=1 Tax=Marivirga sp. TaxID=2018662 RepID=UPI002D7F77D4|nr:HAMP domain-containing sensor histidine kinase [Marivirga sp.]HET8860749.1 HAMP domain-containing sensor histidine kinase [Marivirga sp.]
MSNDQLIDTLNERIKELSCLYELSNISANINLNLEDKLQAIVQSLPEAWRHPQHVIAELNLDSKFFFSDHLPQKHVSQKYILKIDDVDRGYIAIHYDANLYNESVFLPEEVTLIKTLAQEINKIIALSEQKEREEMLQKKFEHSDRLVILGELTAGIAHELNTPLGNILGYAQLIQEHNADHQIAQDTEKIINSAIHSREIVKKLMFFSCEMPQQMQKVSINSLIIEALNLLKFTSKNAGVEIIFTEGSHDIMAKVDPVQFTQVIFNLLINAIHSSSAGQSIFVFIENNTSYFSLTIKDEGHGIKDSLKDKIFEPFFTTKPTGEGSGLGLSVVHGIVKSHGGEISFVSKENTGTSFEVTFPLN